MNIKQILDRMADNLVTSHEFLSEAHYDPNNEIPEWTDEEIEAMIISADVEEILGHEHIIGDPEAPMKSAGNENETAANKTKERYRSLKGNVGVVHDGEPLVYDGEFSESEMSFKDHVDAAFRLITLAKRGDKLAAQYAKFNPDHPKVKAHKQLSSQFRAQAREHTRAASKLANKGMTESEQLDEAQKKSAVQRHNEIVKKLGYSMAAKGHRDFMRQEPPGYKRTEDGLIIKESVSAKELVATAVRYHKAIKKSANNPKLEAKVGNHVVFAKHALASGDEETAIRRANAALSQRYVRLSEDINAQKMKDVSRAHQKALASWTNEKDPVKKKFKAAIVNAHAQRMNVIRQESSKKKLKEGYCHKDLEGEPLSHQPSPAHYAAAFDHHMDRAEEHKKRIDAIDNPSSTTVKTFGHSLRPAHVEWHNFHLDRAKYFYNKLKEIGGPLK